jgi:hypothetical protein
MCFLGFLLEALSFGLGRLGQLLLRTRCGVAGLLGATYESRMISHGLSLSTLTFPRRDARMTVEFREESPACHDASLVRYVLETVHKRGCLRLRTNRGNGQWPAAVYYSVVETCTRYFITYAFYHPLDWSAVTPVLFRVMVSAGLRRAVASGRG